MAETSYPRYSVPKTVLIGLAGAGLFGFKRCFRKDALKMMGGIDPPLRVLGEEYIPQAGPGIIASNHYFRPGFWSPWFPSAISAVTPVDIHWTMAQAWTYPGRRFGRFYRALSQWMLTRVASVYGFDHMPPMPPAPEEVTQRLAAVVRLIGYIRSHPRALVGLAPEGGDQPGGVLNLPSPGFGKLALALSRMGMTFYPVGVYEEEGCFFVRFGAPYRLNIEEPANREQADLLARREVMLHIAKCLPERLRGEF